MQVPYNPVPTAQPSGQATPELRVNATPDAFGVNIGQAIQQLGGTAQHVGDELFQRGLALQKLQNETIAKQADTDYMIKAGEAHAQFSALEGQAAVEAFPEYARNLKQMREDIRNGLSTDEARRMYDSQSLSTMGRSIFNGAGHSASQQKRWSAGVADSRIQADKDGVYTNPQDDIGVERSEQSIVRNVHEKGDLHGWGEEQTGQEVKRELSSSRAMRIAGLSRTDPVKAQEMFEKFRPEMTAKDVYNTEQIVQRQTYTTGARLIDAKVNADLYDQTRSPDAKEIPLSERVAQARALAEKQYPNDPLAVEYATKQVEAGYNRFKQIERQDNDQHRQTVEGALLGLNNQQGRIPATMDELRTDPKVANAFDQMKPTQKRAILATLARNAKGDVTETPERRDRYYQLLGMAQTFPAEYLDTNIASEDIPAKWKTELYKLQLKVQKGAGDDPRVGAAMRQLEPALRGAGITAQSKDEYLKFKGALMGAMEGYRDENKKSPNADEVQKIGARLLQAQSKGWIWNTKQYEMAIPDEAAKAIKEDPEWKGAVPTDEQVRQIYFRAQYQKLYKKSSGITDEVRPPR